MVGVGILVAIMALLVVGPLALRTWQERMQDRALAIRADIDAALRQRFHGESLLAVHVVPEAPWRTGRVEVSVPTGWDPMLVEASAPILAHVPAGYELVVQHPGATPLRPAA